MRVARRWCGWLRVSFLPSGRHPRARDFSGWPVAYPQLPAPPAKPVANFLQKDRHRRTLHASKVCLGAGGGPCRRHGHALVPAAYGAHKHSLTAASQGVARQAGRVLERLPLEVPGRRDGRIELIGFWGGDDEHGNPIWDLFLCQPDPRDDGQAPVQKPQARDALSGRVGSVASTGARPGSSCGPCRMAPLREPGALRPTWRPTTEYGATVMSTTRSRFGSTQLIAMQMTNSFPGPSSSDMVHIRLSRFPVPIPVRRPWQPIGPDLCPCL